MRTAWWINKAINTHSEHVILNVVPLQQWLQERATVLCYTYAGCFVLSKNIQNTCACRCIWQWHCFLSLMEGCNLKIFVYYTHRWFRYPKQLQNRDTVLFGFGTELDASICYVMSQTIRTRCFTMLCDVADYKNLTTSTNNNNLIQHKSYLLYKKFFN
jgi:hypothetical protein